MLFRSRYDWLVKLRISFAIYLRATWEKMASRFASVTNDEITQINDEAVPESTKKPTKFDLAVFEGNGLSFFNTRSLSIKNNEKGFAYKFKLTLHNLTCSRENQS